MLLVKDDDGNYDDLIKFFITADKFELKGITFFSPNILSARVVNRFFNLGGKCKSVLSLMEF